MAPLFLSKLSCSVAWPVNMHTENQSAGWLQLILQYMCIHLLVRPFCWIFISLENSLSLPCLIVNYNVIVIV
uniref:Uncharacterized protein n=1 Tax=Lotus japonicus TaxID=34305 RepID=I3S9C9_LOTJA|nr:unknown [Lotus japonicus]